MKNEFEQKQNELGKLIPLHTHKKMFINFWAEFLLLYVLYLKAVAMLNGEETF